MGRKSKQKGAAFERKICKQLSLWISNGKREDLFWRSAMSGGRATIHGKKAGAQAGDISSIDPEGAWLTDRYYIECKNYRVLDVDSLMYHNKGNLARLIVETLSAAMRHNKKMLLIFKEARKPVTVVTDELPMAADFIDGGFISIQGRGIPPLYFMNFEALLKTDSNRPRKK